MKKLIVAGSILAAFTSHAEEQKIPHIFVANTPAKADEVNSNFEYLLQQLLSNKLSYSEFQVQLEESLQSTNSNLASMQTLLDEQSDSITLLQAGQSDRQESISAINTQLNGYADQMITLQSFVTSNAQSIGGNTQSIRSLQTSVTSNAQVLEAAQQGITGNTQSITNLQSNLSGLGESTKALQISVQGQGENLTSITATVEANTSEIQGVKNSLTSNTSSIATLNTTTSSHASQLNTLATSSSEQSTQLASITNQQQQQGSDLNSLETSVADLSTAVNVNTTAVSSVQLSIQSHSDRITELEKPPEGLPTYDEEVDPHKHVREQEFVYNYQATSPGQQITVGDLTYRMFRLPIMDMETNQRYAIDMPREQSDSYHMSWSTDHSCYAFRYNPSFEIGADAKAVITWSTRDARRYTYRTYTEQITSQYEGTALYPTVNIKVGNITCISFSFYTNKSLEDSVAPVTNGDYDLTDNIQWPAKADRFDELPNLSELVNYVRVNRL